MKIKLSRQQWETIGKTAGWTDQGTFDSHPVSPAVTEIGRLMDVVTQLKDQAEYFYDLSTRSVYQDESPEEKVKARSAATMLLEKAKNSMIDVENSVRELLK